MPNPAILPSITDTKIVVELGKILEFRELINWCQIGNNPTPKRIKRNSKQAILLSLCFDFLKDMLTEADMTKRIESISNSDTLTGFIK